MAGSLPKVRTGPDANSRHRHSNPVVNRGHTGAAQGGAYGSLDDLLVNKRIGVLDHTRPTPTLPHALDRPDYAQGHDCQVPGPIETSNDIGRQDRAR